jgi:hypothetical protein
MWSGFPSGRRWWCRPILDPPSTPPAVYCYTRPIKSSYTDHSLRVDVTRILAQLGATTETNPLIVSIQAANVELVVKLHEISHELQLFIRSKAILTTLML